MQRWINMVEVNSALRREAEFHDWYNTVHVTDRLKTLGFSGVRRYETKEQRDGRGKYLAIWHLDTPGLEQTLKARELDYAVEEKSGRTSVSRNNLTIPIWKDVFWQQISEQVAPSYRKSSRQRWVNMVESFSDPERDAEFNDWYDNIHVPDALQTPGYAGVRRYRIRERRDGRGQYLAVYFIETDDIEETMRLRLARREVELKAGRSAHTRNNMLIQAWRDVLWKEIYERVNPDKLAENSPFAC